MAKKAKKRNFIIIVAQCIAWKFQEMYLWFAEMENLFGQVTAVRPVHILSWCGSRVWEGREMEV